MIAPRFAFADRATDLRTEVLAGLTTFITMSYIVLVNPAILSSTGMPKAGVAAATCLSAGIASILMGLLANAPLALAPGMGLNAYFTYTVVMTMGVPWQTALACVFLSGAAFLALTLAGIRQMIVAAIPQPLFAAVAGGIGLFIGFIGLRNAGLVVANPATLVGLGSLRNPMALTALFGLATISGLSFWRVRGAMVIGILASTIVAAITGQIEFKPQPYDASALGGTAFKLNFAGLVGPHGLGLLEILFVFLFVDLFDNLGTLVAVSRRAGLIGSDGRIQSLNRMLVADSLATMIGALAGTSTVTAYVESAAGVQAGGRTGFAAIITGTLFLVTMFAAPYAQLVPTAATAPALIVVGGLMMAPLAEIDWHDPFVAIPAFLTVVMIPLTFSIANGIAFGITSLAIMKIVSGRLSKGDWLLMILAGLFVGRFAWLAEAG